MIQPVYVEYDNPGILLDMVLQNSRKKVSHALSQLLQRNVDYLGRSGYTSMKIWLAEADTSLTILFYACPYRKGSSSAFEVPAIGLAPEKEIRV